MMLTLFAADCANSGIRERCKAHSTDESRMNQKRIGEARIGASASSVQIVTNGVCLTETLAALERGERGSPLSAKALAAITTQAAEVLESIVAAYAQDVASGEVGADGEGRAGPAAPIVGKAPTGLLYGRVQSGKTAAMIISTAMAIDNNFKIIVVLTSNNIRLVKQTAERFQALDGALVYSSVEAEAGEYRWQADKDNIRRYCSDRGVVFVCAKEDNHLKSLIRFLQEISASDYPAIILDDEADHATPDTQTAARARGRPVRQSSTTFRLVVENDNPSEPGLSLREALPHNVFLQVTATPIGLLLQHLDNPLRPAFTRLLQPGEGYTGGEAFFAQAAESAEPPLVYVDENESAALLDREQNTPEGLARALTFFVVSSTAHRLSYGSFPRSGYKFLCHTSALNAVHQVLADRIRDHVDGLSESFVANPEGALQRPDVIWALTELSRKLGAQIDTARLAFEIARYLPKRKIIVVNSEQSSDMDFDNRYNFIVGGNILGRGLTIEDLLVTYYMRQPRVTQMDTMHQHARMYGYRLKLMPFTRVFLTQSLASRFKGIHESEKALRDLLTGEKSGRSIPVQVAGNLRPTRSNIIDVGSLGAYRPGQQVYPFEPVHAATQVATSYKAIAAILRDIFGGEIRPNTFVPVSLATIQDLLRKIPTQPDDGDWNTDALLHVLDSNKARYSEGYVYVRDFRPTRKILPSGALSGDEYQAARNQNAPVLCLFRGQAGLPWDSDIWYPSVVFPTNMPAVVFNRDD